MILRPVIEKILTFARKALFICEVVLVLRIETTMEDFLFQVSFQGSLHIWFFHFHSLGSLGRLLRSPGVKQKKRRLGGSISFVSVTFPHLIGISISLQLQAVLLAHVSDLT